MDLDGIGLSGVSQTERPMPRDLTYMWNLWNEQTTQKRTDTENMLTAARWGWEVGKKGMGLRSMNS